MTQPSQLTIQSTSKGPSDFVGCFLEDVFFLAHSHVKQLPESDNVEMVFRLSKSEAEALLQKLV